MSLLFPPRTSLASKRLDSLADLLLLSPFFSFSSRVHRFVLSSSLLPLFLPTSDLDISLPNSPLSKILPSPIDHRTPRRRFPPHLLGLNNLTPRHLPRLVRSTPLPNNSISPIHLNRARTHLRRGREEEPLSSRGYFAQSRRRVRGASPAVGSFLLFVVGSHRRRVRWCGRLVDCCWGRCGRRRRRFTRRDELCWRADPIGGSSIAFKRGSVDE